MVIGGLMFVQAQDSRERFRGVVFAGIGTWLFLSAQGLISLRIWDFFWPVVLIVVGISLVLRTGRGGPRRHRRRWEGPGAGPAPFDPPTSAFAADPAERISMFSVMSHVKRASSAANFRGGDVTAFMGGGQLDLRLATIPPGEEAVLDILAVMGGVELFVPGHWEISTPILPFMGGVEDKRLPPLPGDPNARKAAAGRLVLRGFVMMGGVQIKS
jgi:predicted membrane protein